MTPLFQQLRGFSPRNPRHRAPEGVGSGGASKFGSSSLRCLDSLIESVYNGFMKLVVQLQLVPDAESARKLRESVERFNEAANWLAGIAFDQQIPGGP